MNTRIERRSTPAAAAGLHVQTRGKASAGSIVTGYAAMYNSRSELLGGTFYEVIAPGTFRKALDRKPDVRLLVNHDSNLILGRTRSGTLRLTADARGLKIDADLPDNTVGNDISVSLSRGDIDQMSFAFTMLKDEWAEVTVDGQRWTQRTLTDLELSDVSIVTYPAYPATSVQVGRTAHHTIELARMKLRLLSYGR